MGAGLAGIMAVACDPAVEELATSGDTGGVEVADHALGGERPGYVDTHVDPLSTFPLDGSQPYQGPLPADDVPQRFAVHSQLLQVAPDHLQLDVGLRAGPDAVRARDIGVRLALNPQAVRRFRLRDAQGTGRGTVVQRIESLAPGDAAGATWDLLLQAPGREVRGVPNRTRFLGTVTLSWTEAGAEQQRVMVIERP